MMIDFAQYDVSPERGFLPVEDPVIELPSEFSEWNRLAKELPYLILTSRVRQTVATLQTPNLDLLVTNGQLERAMLIISALSMSYIWAEEPAINHVPAALAVPWAAIAERLGRPPIITHSSAVLHNWRRLNPDEGVHADNLACIQHFMGGMDEQWFFTATVALEATGAPALMPLTLAQAAAAQGDTGRVAALLTQVQEVFEKVNVALLRIYEKCDPHIFYTRIRPFLAGWDQTGILFEGVSRTPLKLHGGSAAQSSLIQAYDAALGIEHLHPETQPFLTLMRNYMPPKHRQFIEQLATEKSIYSFVQTHQAAVPALAHVFDQCINELDQFRRTHMEIAVRYILKQGANGEDGLGTGGTSFVPFLSEARKETKAKRISQKE